MVADGSIVIETVIDDKDAQKELTRLSKRIDTLQEKISQKQGKKNALAEEARQIGIEYDNARKKLEQMTSGDAFYTSDHIKQQRAEVSSLEKQWDKVRQSADKLQVELHDGTQEINRMKTRAGELQKQLAATSSSSKVMANAAFPSFLLMRSAPARMFDHWSSPPHCKRHPYFWHSTRKS